MHGHPDECAQPTPDAEQRERLIEWFEDVDLAGYSTAALQAAYDALVSSDTGEPEAS